jgi:ribosomal protein L35AE/L33A
MDLNLTNSQTPIVVSVDQVAENNRNYTVIENATFTDPTPEEGKGFKVFVRNGTAIIGGDSFTEGSFVFRIYYDGAFLNVQIDQTLAQTLKRGNETFSNDIILTELDRIVVGANRAGLSKGTFDTSRGGDKGVSLHCIVGYELNFQAGFLRMFLPEGDGTPLPINSDSEIVYTELVPTTPTYGKSLITKDYADTKEPALGFTPEDIANKKIDLTDNSDTFYPTQKAVKTAVDAKENTITAGTTSQYFRGDKTFQTLDKTAVGLGNVDNTSDSNKPVSTATQTALNLKVDKVAGKGLSENDFTNTLKTKLDGIEDGAQVNVNADWNATSGDAQILNKPTIPSAVTKTSDLTNDGEDGVNPFITALDIPTAGQAGTIVREVKNMTGATLTKGTVVFISGANGNKALVSKARANAESTSARTFGLLQSNILNNGTGYCVVIGDISGLDTSTFTEGAQLYLSGTVAGEYTSTKTLAPTHLVYVGKVTRSHPTQGQIEVQIQNGYELDEIHDVAISSVANNQTLVYETSTTLWKNKSLTTAEVADSTDKRYVTDANLTVIGNTSGTNTGDQTFITPRVQTVASNATVTAVSTNDIVTITAQAVGLTLANPIGAFVEGQSLIIRIKDNGTARSIAYGTNFRAIGVTAPTTTVANKTTYIGCIYNSTDTKFDIVGTCTEA